MSPVMPGGVTVGDSGLCCCVLCLSSAIISLCLLINRHFLFSFLFFFFFFFGGVVMLFYWDFSHGKFGLLSLGKAGCNRVVLPNLQWMLGVLAFAKSTEL